MKNMMGHSFDIFFFKMKHPFNNHENKGHPFDFCPVLFIRNLNDTCDIGETEMVYDILE